MASQPDITLYFLGASRAIRIAWLLEELNLPYKLVSAPRANNGLAPPEFKEKVGTSLGKSPTIKDGDLVVQESGAITEYLCETYDPSNNLIPSDRTQRSKVREWISASEATFMLHALAILYARWHIPEPQKTDGTLSHMEQKLSVNVQKDLSWLESELKASAARGEEGKYLVGDRLTAADIMMGFSVRFIFTRRLGTGEQDGEEGQERWGVVRKWLENIEGREGYRRAVETTGFTL